MLTLTNVSGILFAMIKVKAKVGYDLDHREQTDIGVMWGKTEYESVSLTKEEAQKIIQGLVDHLPYEDAQNFVNKYKK